MLWIYIGAVCPDPLLQVHTAMGGVASGGRLVVLLDYPLALENISRWAKGAGFQVGPGPARGN